MTVLTKCVILENEKFVLIKDTSKELAKASEYKNCEYFGTIPYTELDEQGRMKRTLNGLQICMQPTASEAIRQRLLNIKLKKFKEENPNATDKEIILKATELIETIQ